MTDAPARPAESSSSGGSPDRLVGRVLSGRYRIEAVLGSGGVGVVYRAVHTVLNRPVALKVLHEEYGALPEIRRRFEREARALSALGHPHIVGINDYGIADGMPYLTMELVEGRTLAELIDHDGPPDPETALDIARQMLRGLAFAHARGVLHRDLKPANVFLQSLPDDPYHVKILDFGLAKMVGESDADANAEPTLTRSGTILGTPAYMAPEQASGSVVDARADVYSAGCVLFELLCGRGPFVAPTRAEIVRAHLVEPMPHPADVRRELDVSPALYALLDRALAKDRADRFKDGGEMLAALDALPKPAARIAHVGEQRVFRSADDRQFEADASTVASSPPPAPARKKEGLGTIFRSIVDHPRASMVATGLGVLVFIAGLFIAAAILMSDGGDTAATGEPPRVAGESPAPASAKAAKSTVAGQPSPTPAASDDTAREAAEERPATPEGPLPVEPTAEGEEPTPSAGEDPIPALDLSNTAPDANRQPPIDYFDRPLPPELRRYRRNVLRGRPLGRDAIRDLRVLQREHPLDPRPSLLMAHEFANRGWFSDALTWYQRAYQVTTSARGDERMLPDLVRMVRATGAVSAPAAVAIVRMYGSEARRAVAQALAEETNAEARGRLEALRDALR